MNRRMLFNAKANPRLFFSQSNIQGNRLYLNFSEVAKFFRCLRQVDDIDLALSLYRESGTSLSEGPSI